jgi:hypothetical protein
MNGSHDISSTPSVGGDDDRFEPSDAADLLVSTRRKARRGFEQRSPLRPAMPPTETSTD